MKAHEKGRIPAGRLRSRAVATAFFLVAGSGWEAPFLTSVERAPFAGVWPCD